MLQTGREQGAYRDRSGIVATTHLLYVRATISELRQPLLAFALLKQDPLPTIREQLLKAQYAEQDIRERYQCIRATWNAAFLPLPIEQIFFVCAWHAVHGAPIAIKQSAGLTLTFTSSEHWSRRWLITRPTWHAGELVAWCIEIVPHAQDPRTLLVVTLSAQNMLRLMKCANAPQLSC